MEGRPRPEDFEPNPLDLDPEYVEGLKTVKPAGKKRAEELAKEGAENDPSLMRSDQVFDVKNLESIKTISFKEEAPPHPGTPAYNKLPVGEQIEAELYWQNKKAA